MSFDVDFGDLDAVARMFENSAEVMPRKVHQAVEVNARHIKDDARKIARRIGAPAQHYSRSITYDIHDLGSSVYAEIGPDKDKTQGALGNLLEFGSVNNAPRPHLGPAFQQNKGDLEDGLAKAVEESLQ